MKLNELFEEHKLKDKGYVLEYVHQHKYFNLRNKSGEAIAYQMKGQEIMYLHGRSTKEDREILDPIFGKPEPLGKIDGLFPPIERGDEQ